MMKQKEVEAKLKENQSLEMWKDGIRLLAGDDWILRQMVAMLHKEDRAKQERLEAAEGSSRKRNLKIYMGRVRENWHDQLVYDYYGYEEERMKQIEGKMEYEEG